MALVSVELVLGIMNNGMESRFEALKGIVFQPWTCKAQANVLHGSMFCRFLELEVLVVRIPLKV